MDRAADAFAALLAGAAEEEPDPVRRRVLEQLLYHLGRWIYLVDAADDLKKDVKSGSYNPLVYRFHAEGGTLTAEDRAALAATLDSSVRAMAAAFELADFGPWRAIRGPVRGGRGVAERHFPQRTQKKTTKGRRLICAIPIRCWASPAPPQTKK